LLAFFTAFLVATAASAFLVWSKRWHMRFSADHFEGAQKFHARATPRIGGLAIAFGLGAAFLTGEAPAAVLGPLLIAGALPFAVGLTEDITNNGGVKRRLFFIAGGGLLFCVLADQWVRYVGLASIDPLLATPALGMAFTVFALTGAANAINIIDGFNGLAGGVSFLILAALAIIADQVGDGALMMVLLGFMGAIAGFLVLNFPRGKLFLGDGGAYLVGFLVGACAILLPMRNPDVSPWVALVVCAYPLLEVLFSVYRKSKREGYSPTQPDGVHLHMLVYRRITRHRLKHASAATRNAATSPFLWAYAAGPALGAVLFYDNQALLMATLGLSAVAYGLIYRRLTRFRWLPRSARAVLPLQAPHGAATSPK
jgi:UDP-N-acetylmuramyl pentapeptide phosphotransferase/UDP-N-acetylglucosamine-1-phosphate transferase